MQIKIFAEARTEAINIIGGLISSSSSQCSDGAPAGIKLMARIEEKLPSFATSAGQPAQPTHGLVSGLVRDAVCSLTDITENPFMEKWS